MKNKIIIFVLIIFLACSQTVLAQEPENVVSAGLKPGDTFYFFDNLMESINLLVTFRPQKRLEKLIEYSEEKADEIEQLKNEDSIAAVNLYSKYTAQMPKVFDKLEARNIDVSEYAEEVYTNSLKHLDTLSRVRSQVAEQAQPAIDNAIENSKRSNEAAVKRVEEHVQIKRRVEDGKQEGETERNRQEVKESTGSGKAVEKDGTSPPMPEEDVPLDKSFEEKNTQSQKQNPEPSKSNKNLPFEVITEPPENKPSTGNNMQQGN